MSKPGAKIRHVLTCLIQKKAIKVPKTFCARSIECLFKRYLFITNSITSGVFMAVGDMIQQEYEYQTNKLALRYDWERMKSMGIVGGCLGSLHHFYYLYLDILLPKRSVKFVLLKIAGDQFFCAPLTIVCFFYGIGYLENKTLAQSTEEIQNKFKYVYLGDCVFWPPVQAINFYYVPTEYRVFYINIATMVFDVFLSLMKHDF